MPFYGQTVFCCVINIYVTFHTYSFGIFYNVLLIIANDNYMSRKVFLGTICFKEMEKPDIVLPGNTIINAFYFIFLHE